MIRLLRASNPWLIAVPLVLGLVSCIIIYSLGSGVSGGLYKRQALFLLVGLIVYGLVSLSSINTIRSLSGVLYGVVLLLLALVPVLGRQDFGATLRIDLGPVELQPGELAKLAVLLAVASLLTTVARSVSWGRFLVVAGLIMVPLGLIIREDFGTAVLLSCGVLALLASARLQKSQRNLVIVGVVSALGVGGLAIANIGGFGGLLKDYQRSRLTSFVNPERDKSGSGYNVLQSVIAVGSGGLWGRGLGNGTQSQYNYLPVAHTDFIAAVIGESWGFLGLGGIILLYGILIAQLIRCADLVRDEFSRIFLRGAAALFLAHLLVNVGMNLGSMPVTGIPLPFLSYGGSTIVTHAAILGVAQAAWIRHRLTSLM